MTGQIGVVSEFLSRDGVVSDYLLKPFDPNHLLERVRAYLAAPETHTSPEGSPR
jgi:DNA-binding response OmpR family regulator